MFTRLCAGMILAVSIAGSAGAATLAGVEFSVTVPDRFAMNPNPFTIGSGGARTVAGNGGLPGDPSFTFDFSTSGRLDLTIGGDSNLVIGGAEAFLFNLTGEERPTITGFDLISTDILNFDRADIGFTGGNLIIVIGGQDGNQPQWQPGHSATFQISTAVGAEIRCPRPCSCWWRPPSPLSPSSAAGRPPDPTAASPRSSLRTRASLAWGGRDGRPVGGMRHRWTPHPDGWHEIESVPFVASQSCICRELDVL